MERDLSRVSLTSFSHGDPSLASYNWDEVFVPAPPTSLLPSLTTFWAVSYTHLTLPTNREV